MKRVLVVFALAALTLTGCSSDPTPANLPAVEQYVGDTESTERVIGYAEAIEDSYAKLYETGMSETVTSAGDRYILSYAPQENFYAGLYNLEIEDVVIIEQEELFTVAAAHLALQDPITVIAETENGVSITHPEYGDFSLVIADGLVVSGSDNNGTWTGEFSYVPNEMVTKLVADIIATEN